MITFLDENDVEYGALATIKATNAVNGERSLTGTIVSGDYVLSNIERGWRLRFDDEYFVVTYAKPIDEGRDVQVEFDAVHQFFWDFDKSSVYDQLADGSHTFVAYLEFIFKNSGYSYTVDSALNVHAFEKQSFGFKKRLTLFNDIITSTGVEFQVNGKVVRILEKVGTDLSTVVRKNFNMNELTIEKNIGDFVTYQKGFGAYFDEEDHSKGRLEVEYTSPLASVYGKLEAEPLVDERYSQSSSLLAVLKENVDNSYTISVSLDMEDLTRAGYKYKQPVAGDYIMAINETLDFQEKIRIVSFTSEYDVDGQLIKHTVTCNDIGSVKKLSASYNLTKKQASSASATANNAYSVANKALISADGKNTNYYGDSFPVDNPKGTLKKGDLLFLTVGDTVKQYYWNGSDWIINPVLDDVEAFKEQIAEELKDVPNREEFENKIAEELATSKAEIETQIETAKTQAESNAKEYADTINGETAKVAELANAAADEIKADLVNVKNNLTDTSLVANNAQAAVDAAKQELTAVNTKVDNAKAELTQAKQDLMSHAQQLQTQANAQTELSKRVTNVETTANGTKTTVSELSKTVDSNTKNITSVTARTKVVEDDLAGTKTTLSQVKTTAENTSKKTATLETGLNGLSAKFENLNVGTTNHFMDSAFETTIQKIGIWQSGNVYTPSIDTTEKYDGYNTLKIVCRDSAGVDNPKIIYPALAKLKTVQQGKLPDVVTISFWGKTDTAGMGLYTRLGFTGYEGSQNVTLTTDWKRYIVHVKTSSAATNEWLFKLSKAGTVWIAKPQFEFAAIASDYHLAEEDTSSKVAEYKQTADQNYARLQSNLQTLDGTVKQNKSEFDQTASQLRTTISAVEGKIPTAVGARNYIRNYGLTATGWGNTTAGWKFEIISDSTAKSGQYLKATCTTASTRGGGFHKNLFDFSDGRFFGKKMTWSMDIKLSKNKPVKIGPEWGYAYLDTNATTEWKRYSKTFTVATTTQYKSWIFYTNDNVWSVGDIVYIRDVQLEDGSIATSPVPAIEDTESDITKLSSELTQTKDGITLLATKTELNTAKNELQSGINTHTTQISALNTGLQAKVSQADFNTLSGRVTTAENNITAKANELSSKISSVEGKIPTNIGTVNLIVKSTAQKGFRLGSDGGRFPDSKHELTDWIKIEPNKTYTLTTYEDVNEANMYYSLSWYSTNNADYSGGISRPTGAATAAGLKGGKQYRSPANAKYAKVSYPTKYAKVKFECGNIATDYNPNPEDYDNALTKAQSEFKQTTDAIKASVSSLDKSTIKSSSLTINSDGIVMKAGKSTTDVANAIGSYFSVNQNAINLFSDKINVKANMIVNGAITSDKIASKSINTSHLNGKIITADVISSNAVTADAIKAGAVTTDKMSANSINGDRIAAGTLDAAKIKAGSITASQIASGTITSNQIKAGGISSANIAAGAITGDKIAAGAIDANKIAANAITANMIRGGQLKSTNGATSFDLNSGTLTFNNNFGYIQRVANGKVFEISSSLINGSSDVREHLSSAYIVRKSDNSRKSGMLVSLYNPIENKPTAQVDINADSFNLLDSKSTTLLSINGSNNYLGNWNVYGWGDIPLAFLNGGLTAKDVGLEGHTESLKHIIERLCEKTGLWWM